MPRTSWCALVLLLLSNGLLAQADLAQRAMSVLRDNCLSCHNPDKQKGKLLLTSRDLAIKGGEHEDVLVPHKADASRLIAVLSADSDTHMPPKGQLADAEIATLRQWIDAGAPWDDVTLARKQSATTQPAVRLRPLPNNYTPVLALALSPDQKRLAVGRSDRILLYDLAHKDRPLVAEHRTANDVVQSLAWSPDNKHLAAGHYRRVRIFTADLGHVRDIDNLDGRITALTFLPGNVLAAAVGHVASPAKIHLFDIPGATPAGDWPAHADSILSMRVAPDGKHLATAAADKHVKVWNLATKAEIAKLEGHTAPVAAVAFHPEGKLLATAGADKEIKVWEWAGKEQKKSYNTNPLGVTDLAWLDDKQLLSAAEDGLARLSAENFGANRAGRTFAGAPDILYCMAVTSDRKTLFAGSHDGNTYVWTVASGKLEGTLAGELKPSTRPTTLPSERLLSFTNDVLPVLARAGCAAGACHAKPAGQAGFKLSVFSFDPKSDHRAILKDARGRRVFLAAPEDSLLLRKATLAVDHGGGLRLKKDSDAYRLLLRWLEQGAPYARPDDPTLAAVAVEPKDARYVKGSSKPLRLVARFSDGSTRDVTHLSDFSSNDKMVASVTESGVVRAGMYPGDTVVIARYMGLVDTSRVTIPPDKSLPDSVFASLPVNNYVDAHVYARLKTLGIRPSDRCTDEEFLRRASLDVAGVLPTIEQTRAFLADPAPDKREQLIDRLLEAPTWPDHWANKYGDLLRPNPFRAGVKSVYTLDQWLRASFRENKPYDRFASELILAQGSTHQYGPPVVYRDKRDPADLASYFGQILLGVRLECAKCHHHPSEKWSQDDFYQFAAFFGQLKRKGQGISAPISGEAEFFWHAPGAGNKGDVKHPVTGETMKPKAPDGPLEAIPENRDPRESLAGWMTSPDNAFFARAVVNRVWAEMMGRGIVHPVDDFRASNPPSNEPLLDALAKDFVAHKFDLKHLMRTIARSHTYQLSSLPNPDNATDNKNFSRYYRRRPGAEVLFDAVCDLTGVPENLPGLAPGSRAIQVWNNRLDSDFLDAFGRPNPSADPPCERERENSVVQVLHLMNSTKLTAKIANPNGRATRLARSELPPDEVVIQLYLAAYARHPSTEELRRAVAAFSAEGATRQTAAEDLMWSLINSAEFVFNH